MTVERYILKLAKFGVVLRFQNSDTVCCIEGPVAVRAEGVTVIVVDPLIFGSDWLVAVMVTRVAVETIGAVNKPRELTFPAVDDHVTDRLEVWMTLASNCRLVPEITVAFGEDVGEVTVILCGSDPVLEDRPPPPNEEPPQPPRQRKPESVTQTWSRYSNFTLRERRTVPINVSMFRSRPITFLRGVKTPLLLSREQKV
jgi:hypothetical protein